MINKNKLTLATVCFMLMAPVALSNQMTSSVDLQKEAQRRISGFAKELQQTLKKTIGSQGLSAGITVCRDQAPIIAKRWSTDGWEVGRRSLKWRNPLNQPDAWERDILLRFDQLFSAKMPVDMLRAESLTQQQGQHSYQYMQAIPTQQLCLACHGENLNKDVADHLQKLYPSDNGTGYQLPSLRGAFSVNYQKR